MGRVTCLLTFVNPRSACSLREGFARTGPTFDAGALQTCFASREIKVQLKG